MPRPEFDHRRSADSHGRHGTIYIYLEPVFDTEFSHGSEPDSDADSDDDVHGDGT